MTELVIEHESFTALVDPAAEVEFLGGDCLWSEGPAWLPWEQAVIWSDIPNDRVMRWSVAEGVSVYRTGVEYTNGRVVDAAGGVVTCSHGRRRIERWNRDGTVTPLVDRYQGRRLNSPNDVVVKSDGTIWFTDPPYGILSDREGHAAEPELPACYAFRFDPETGALNVVTDLLTHPNGLAFSPDESRLLVSDTSGGAIDGGTHHLWSFDVVSGVAITNPTVFAVVEPGVPDGFRFDATGHVFSSAHDGIQVFDPSGHRVGVIPVPEITSNCTFGGPDGSDLFITATPGLFRIRTKTRGAT
jgi:gluconolactonase